MSKHRRFSIKKDNVRRRRLALDGTCRYCKGAVQPPRRTFCSKECVHEWKLRSDVKYMRQFIYERDLGMCALCGVDTRYTKIYLEDLQRRVRNRISGADKDLKYKLESLKITVKESLRTLWHADHIVPVKDGGGLCGLDNLRTLCVACHKDVTKKSRSKPV